jgi:hypothetical protein
MASRPRILIASPHAAETTVVADWLASEGFEPVRVSSLLRDLLVADFAFLFRQNVEVIGAARARNPKTPIIVIGEPDAASESQAVRRGAMYLPRPVDRASLVCTVGMAMMESRPVRRSIRKPVSRFDAVVEGIPSHIIDVSNEGLRLEIPRGRKSAPPPFFNVHVPMIGVALIVRRMWTASLPDSARDAAWYGGELSRNPPRAERAWRAFVDAIPGGSAVLELQ